MDTFPLPADVAVRGAANRPPQLRVMYRSPRTVAEVLQEALEAADAEDARMERELDPLVYALVHRPRRLIDRLLGRL